MSNHISDIFELYNKLKPDWVCIHALDLHSQMHTEAFQKIRSCMSSTRDIKSVSKIRGGASVIAEICMAPHLNSPQPLNALEYKSCFGFFYFFFLNATHQCSLSDVHSSSENHRKYLHTSVHSFQHLHNPWVWFGLCYVMFSGYSGFLPHVKKNAH